MRDQSGSDGATPLDLEAACLSLIASAGEGQTLAIQALGRALADDLEQAEKLLVEAEQRLREAHHIQFSELISREARGEEVPMRLLIVHGMDLLSAATVHKDLVTAMISAKRQPTHASKEDA